MNFNAEGTAPVNSVFKHLYDGDAAGKQQLALRSPDNADWSADGNIYVNEDRSTPFEGAEASVWKVNDSTGAAERILVMNRDAALPAGQIDKEAGSLGAPGRAAASRMSPSSTATALAPTSSSRFWPTVSPVAPSTP